MCGFQDILPKGKGNYQINIEQLHVHVVTPDGKAGDIRFGTNGDNWKFNFHNQGTASSTVVNKEASLGTSLGDLIKKVREAESKLVTAALKDTKPAIEAMVVDLKGYKEFDQAITSPTEKLVVQDAIKTQMYDAASKMYSGSGVNELRGILDRVETPSFYDLKIGEFITEQQKEGVTKFDVDTEKLGTYFSGKLSGAVVQTFPEASLEYKAGKSEGAIPVASVSSKDGKTFKVFYKKSAESSNSIDIDLTADSDKKLTGLTNNVHEQAAFKALHKVACGNEGDASNLLAVRGSEDSEKCGVQLNDFIAYTLAPDANGGAGDKCGNNQDINACAEDLGNKLSYTGPYLPSAADQLYQNYEEFRPAEDHEDL